MKNLTILLNNSYCILGVLSLIHKKWRKVFSYVNALFKEYIDNFICLTYSPTTFNKLVCINII